MEKLEAQQLITSQTMSRTDYIIPTDNLLELLLHSNQIFLI